MRLYKVPLEERPFRSSMTAVNSVSSPKAFCTTSMTLMTWLSVIFNDIIARHLEGIHIGRAATPQCRPWTNVTAYLECEQSQIIRTFGRRVPNILLATAITFLVFGQTFKGQFYSAFVLPIVRTRFSNT